MSIKVKQLEWHGEPEWCFADTPVGHYTICRRTNPSCYRVDSHGRDRMESFDASSGDAARAAAQADFDKRILAWIIIEDCAGSNPSLPSKTAPA